MGQNDRRRDVGGDQLPCFHYSSIATVIWFRWSIAHHLAGVFKMVISVGVTQKRSGLNPLERAGSIPCPLIVGVKRISLQIDPDSTRRADTTGSGHCGAVLVYLDDPPTVERLAGVGAGEAMNRPDVAVRIETGTERKFMIISTDPPVI